VRKILVQAVCERIIMARVVFAILTECRGILLVHVQCGYMLWHDNLINGARGVLVHGGSVLNFGMVQCVECNACGILAREQKFCVQKVIVHEPKLFMVDMGMQHKNSVHRLLARQRSDPHWL
jgi:hypothetical protein